MIGYCIQIQYEENNMNLRNVNTNTRKTPCTSVNEMNRGGNLHRPLAIRLSASLVFLVILSLLSLPSVAAGATTTSGELSQGDTWSYNFAEEGNTTYWCSPHPSMTGDIEVVSVGTAGALSGNIDIVISEYAFSPSNLTVEVGTTVTWTNNDPVVHTVELDFEGGPAPEGGMAMKHGGSMSFTMFWEMTGWWGVIGALLVISAVLFTITSPIKSVTGVRVEETTDGSPINQFNGK
jgi:plastocyanin